MRSRKYTRTLGAGLAGLLAVSLAVVSARQAVAIMIGLIIIIGLAIAAVMVAFVRQRSGHRSSSDLGTLSNHWIAEQRMGPDRFR